ncbi:methyltransferase [Evansella vedderi]|uniref:Methyltransferase n=1 Tax=Evansella vedderi TaxID=38282 RepID=A0ABT9ZVE0_9BACI|nr:isoprenylcysteine carboxylmethyltransferase family protein [Evansella vedderi]MDQ0254080.1 methyltransferase [Evansella vedderi]
MTIYWIVLAVVMFQRGMELFIARRNEIWMKGRGAKEFGEEHYLLVVLLHGSFFVFLTAEVWYREAELIPWWLVLGIAFFTVQIIRFWVLVSLGRYWNTKIIVLPGEKIVKKGPYKWVSHPNYWVVAMELLILPLLFGAYMTAILFTLLNAAFLLLIRIPQEDEALRLLNQE